MSERLQGLAHAVYHKPSEPLASDEFFEASAPATTAGSLYEKVRTVVDYQEEHLLRRNAILRIIKRFLGADIPIENMAENLLKELIWAKYLPNKKIPTRFVRELVPLFRKYEPLLRRVDKSSARREEAFQWVLDVFSTEVEYAISPPVSEEALVSYTYEELRDRIYWDPKVPISEEDKDLRLYIAIHNTLLKSNPATLRFRVMTLYYPDWPGASTPERIEEIVAHLDRVIETVDAQIQSLVTVKLATMVRRKTGVFHVIRDVIEAHPTDFVEVLKNPDVLDREVVKALKRRTAEFRKRQRRTVVRSVAFLFLTKMLLALVIEVPVDLLLAHDKIIVPLLMNIFFHPFFLALIASTATIPERRNTEDHVAAVRALVVGADHELLTLRMKGDSLSAWSRIFDAMYAFTFLLTYGFIAVILTRLGFNVVSATLFLFFLSLVTFFGIRIRTSTKDIILSPSRSGVIGSVFDVFMLPLVRAGRWLSLKVSKINIFIYFFDFIIESPYKVVVRFIEGWVTFIREKKEEI